MAKQQPKPTGNRPDTQDPFQNPALRLLADTADAPGAEFTKSSAECWSDFVNEYGEFALNIPRALSEQELDALKRAIISCFKSKNKPVDFLGLDQEEGMSFRIQKVEDTADKDAIKRIVIEICDAAMDLSKGRDTPKGK